MREILFRGKNAKGEWEYGVPLITGLNSEIAYITPANSYDCRVDIDTVGQYTGLTDKNGKKIFDGDILVFCKGATHPIKVYYDGLGWKFLRNGKRIEDAFECNIISHIQSCEIIGNIHDNPELLKGE